MGWLYDRPDASKCYDHEGYVVMLTYRIDASGHRCRELFVELSWPDTATYEPEAIARIQAGCECGWRSPYLVPERGFYHGETMNFHLPRWQPFTAWVTEADEERCRELWSEHMRQAVPRLAKREKENA